MKISSIDAGRRPCYSMPLRNDSRRDTAKGVLGETAAATAASQSHGSAPLTAKQWGTLLHPISTD